MNPTPPRSTARRLALLTAALLHLLGASVLPALHAWKWGAAPLAAAVAAEPEPGQPGSAVHDELHCAVCHASGGAALPAAGAELTGIASAAARFTPEPGHLDPRRPESPTRVRGPPHHS